MCASTLLLEGAVRLDNYILRRRAERLLADIRSLDLRKSSYSDAQKAWDRYPHNVQTEGPCRPSRCDVSIALDGTAWRHIEFLGKHQQLLDFYSRIGGRLAYVRASIRVRNNAVWGKSFWEIVESGNCERDSDGVRVCLALIGSFSTDDVPRHPPFSHPEYEIGKSGGCTFCMDAYVKFTPYADPADIRRLSDINLSCITRLHPCETRDDILPSAWKEHAADLPPWEAGASVCSPVVARAFSRESERVAVGVVLPHLRGQLQDEFRLRIVKEIKGGGTRVPLNEYPDYLREYSFFGSALSARTGDRYIAFFRAENDAPQTCLTPATVDNLRIMVEGIAEDWSDPPILADPPVRDIGPPRAGLR